MIPELLLGLVLEDGRRWGEVACDFQRADADAILDPDSPTRQHFLTRPRGASKTTDLAAMVLVALLEQLPAGAQSYAVAADRDQAQLLLREVGGFVRRTHLDNHVQVDTFRATALNTGASLTALAADDAGAFGLRPHFVVVDELAQWNTSGRPQRMWEAVYSSIPKVSDARLVVITTAGDPAHWSHRILEHAASSDRWRLHEVPGPCPWIDPAALAEQEAALLPSQYARLHLNRWIEAEDRLTSTDDLAACVAHAAPLDFRPGRTYAVGLDIGLTNDRTVLSVCHVEEANDGRRLVVLDRQVVWSGSRKAPVDLREVEATALHVYEAYRRPTFVVDPYQAALLMQNLRLHRVKVHEYNFNQASIGRLAQRLYQLLRDHALRLPDDSELLDELANVRIRETSPGLYRMDHDADRHDDRAISLALAANWLLTEQPRRRLLRFGAESDEPPTPIPHQPPKPGLEHPSEVFEGLSDYYGS